MSSKVRSSKVRSSKVRSSKVRSSRVKKPVKKPKFSRVTPEYRRQLLIEATIKCLAKQVGNSITVENICKQAGVSRGLLGYYFDGKQDIILQTYLYVSEEFSLKANSVLDDDHLQPYDKIQHLIYTSFREPIFTRENVIIWLSICNLVRTDKRLSETDKNLYNRYRSKVAEVFAQYSKETGVQLNAAVVALGFTALIDGLWLQWSLDNKAFTPQEAEAICFDYINRLFPKN